VTILNEEKKKKKENYFSVVPVIGMGDREECEPLSICIPCKRFAQPLF
jgi:hypothetical protein